MSEFSPIEEATMRIDELQEELQQLEQATQRVRDLAERFNKEHLVSPFPAMAQEILKALDGEQE